MTKFAETFKVTEEHLALLSKMYVGWDDCEYGAPAIDCKRPYGNSYVEGDIAKILGIKDNLEDEKVIARIRKLHEETQTVLQIALATGRFRSGMYGKTEKYNSRSWLPID